MTREAEINVATRQGMPPRIAPAVGIGKEGILQRFCREDSPADILISDFWLPNL